MDNKYNSQSPAKIADVDSYNQQQLYEYYEESSSQPSAPPESEVYTPLIQHVPQHYNHVQPQYQTIQMPIPQQYTQPRDQYIIRKRGTDGRQFPIQASIFLLGCIVPPVWCIACCWPSNNRYEIAWRKLNYCMIVLFTLCIVLIILMVAMITINDGEWPDPDPVWRIPHLFSSS